MQYYRYAQHDPWPTSHIDHPDKIHNNTPHGYQTQPYKVNVERSTKRKQTNPHLPKAWPNTNRRSGGTILAARRDTYKEAIAIPSPPHHRDCMTAATLTPYNGSPILAISAYMLHLHTKSQDTLYIGILTWIHTEIISKHPSVITLMDGDLQATPWEGDERPYYALLNKFCTKSGL